MMGEERPVWVDKSELVAQADWNQNDENAPDYVKNRTHYEDTILVDAGDTFQPTVFVPFNSSSTLTSTSNGGMVKVSDLTPEISALVETGVAKKISVATNGSNTELKYQVKITEESEYGTTLTYYNNRSNWYGSIAVVYEPGHSVCSNYDRKGLPSTEYFAVLNEPGIYFRYTERDNVKDSMSLHKLTWNELQQLDEKYIPSSIARVSDIPEAETEDEALDMLAEMGILDPVTDEEDNIFTDENGDIFTV